MTMLRMFPVLAVLALAQLSTAAVIGADWTNETSGSLGGVSITVTNGDSNFDPVRTWPLLGSNFSFAPLGISEVLQYRTNADITFTFDRAINDLLLYAVGWRGDFFAPGVDDPASTYTFSAAFTVESGFSTAIVEGSSVTVDDDFTTFENGILRFNAPVISLTIDYTPGVDVGFGQLLTFGVDATCGDGNLDIGEDCDDGNFVNGDGCSANCRYELSVTKQIRTKMFIGPIGISGCDPIAVVNPFPSATYGLRIAAFLSFCIATDLSFGENPVEGDLFIPLDARVASIVDIQWTCESGNPIPTIGSVTPVVTVGGPEPLGFAGVANPIITANSIAVDGSWAFVSSGRPNSSLESAFQAFRVRENADIWHRVDGSVACGTDGDGLPTADLAVRFAPHTRFPSHRSYLYDINPSTFNGILETANQDAFSNLWFLPPRPVVASASDDLTSTVAINAIGTVNQSCTYTVPESPDPLPPDFDFTPLAADWCSQLEVCGFDVSTCLTDFLDAVSSPIPDPVLPLADDSTLTSPGVTISFSCDTCTVDIDGDEVNNIVDNCTLVPNADQRDTNGDNLGNMCDADLSNDCTVDFVDLGLMKSVFFCSDSSQACMDADLNGDGIVDFLDLGGMKAMFFLPPGPAASPNNCD